MIRISLLALVVLALTATKPHQMTTEWGWFRASSGVNDWAIYKGRATVLVDGKSFKATLWDAADPKFARVSLLGTIQENSVSVRAVINQSDADPFQTSGRLRRICWEGGGREAILLTSSFGVIGLTRELSRGACHPTDRWYSVGRGMSVMLRVSPTGPRPPGWRPPQTLTGIARASRATLGACSTGTGQGLSEK